MKEIQRFESADRGLRGACEATDQERKDRDETVKRHHASSIEEAQRAPTGLNSKERASDGGECTVTLPVFAHVDA